MLPGLCRVKASFLFRQIRDSAACCFSRFLLPQFRGLR